MLARAQKHHGDPRGVHHAHQAAHHVPHRIALADDKPVQLPGCSERGVETARLRHAVGPDEGFADHEDFVRLGEGGEFLERGHQSGVIVAPACCVDQNDVEPLRGGEADGVFGDVGRVFAVAFFVELDFAQAFAFGEFFQIARVHAELLDCAGAERVAGGDEEVEVVLQKEEG